mgnify:CR=1 FL=1
MQTKRVIDTIRWLNKVFPDAERTLLVLTQPERDVLAVASAANKLGRFSHAVEQNPDAVAVLKAFQLEDILSPKLFQSSKKGPIRQTGALLLRNWRTMTRAAEPLEELTVPHVKLAQDEGEIDLNLLDRGDLSLKTLIAVLVNLESLYEAVAEATGEKKLSPIEIIKIESGTSLSINLKGLGSPIKEIKKLILQIWSEHRHKKADEIISHNKAIASSLEIVTQWSYPG